jgi:uncharacterized protein YjbI with pentapeptide repeats
LDEADLRNADFRGLPLSGVSLRGADLRGADFRGANLDGTVFTASCLSGARFARAAVTSSITGVALADFTYTDGRDVDFSHARLDGADFEAATLRGVTLRGASTAHVRWPAGWTATGARASPPTGLRPCERVAERDEPG